MTRILTILPVLFLTGCCNFGGVRSPADLPHQQPQVWIEPVLQEHHPDGKRVTRDDGSHYDTLFDVRVRFHETTDYTCLIQIITNEHGKTLVEVFRPNEHGIYRLCGFDRHRGSSYGVRRMIVYPGEVSDDVVWDDDFAMLERSEGCEVTNVPSSWNADHQAEFGVHGHVTDADRSLGVEWSIESSEDGLTVTIPPERLVE